VSVVGSVGLSFESPIAVDVNVRVASFTKTVDVIVSPELGLNGVL
jgi:hypothetical protein